MITTEQWKTAWKEQVMQRKNAINLALSENPNMSVTEIARSIGCSTGTIHKYKRLLKLN